MTQVSIIVPMRNAQRYVEATLRSLLRERAVDLEICVVDDGSTDRSADTVLALAAHDARVRLLAGPCQGIAASFNAGLAASRGEIIMRCDADDLYAEGRIRLQVDWLAEHPSDAAVCGGFRTIDAAGKPIATLVVNERPRAEDISAELRSGATRTHLGTFAIRRSALPGNAWLRPYFETAEDIDFQLRCGEAGPVHYLPAVGYAYRLHGASITHVQSDARRMFYESQARLFQRQRLDRGVDELTAGGTPALAAPADGAPSRHLQGQLQGMMQGVLWQNFDAGRYAAAWKAAARAIGYAPLRSQGWRALAALAWKSVGAGFKAR